LTIDRAIIATMLVLVGAWACHRSNLPVLTTEAFVDLPECPRGGNWAPRFNQKKYEIAGFVAGQLSLARRRTNVPEFNDCQQFIKVDGNGTSSYLPLFAIFSRDDLALFASRLDEVPTLITAADSSVALAAGRPLPVGEIYALNQGYATLGIEPEFNCLFLYAKYGTPSGLEAKVVPVGVDEKKCSAAGTDTLKGKALEVHRQFFGKSGGNVPDVARWDWDSKKNEQHMGIGCGKAWCDIGASAFTPSSAHAATIISPDDRVRAVKGWYDEQTLAFPLIPPSVGPPHVGTVVGTLVPAPDLGDESGDPQLTHFASSWKPVATVAIPLTTTYMNKLNLQESSFPRMTDSVFLCWGNQRKDCIADSVTYKPQCTPGDTLQGKWWSKIVSRSGSVALSGAGATAAPPSIRYYCVSRRGHEDMLNFHIPGVVRWRWDIKDETMWVRCLEGCCEVEAGHS
jgi:hypothetical protein